MRKEWISPMSEHRSPYYAFSGKCLLQQSTISSLVQHHIDGSLSRDTVLLLPILSSSQSTDQPSPCLHLAHLPGGLLGLCNMHTLHTCPCCGNAMCWAHQSERSVALPDVSGTGPEEDDTFLCTACAHFSTDMIYALYTFRHAINDLDGQVHS